MENIVERKNKDNPTYINWAMGLLYYFKQGGFHIRENKRYGYQVFIDKKDEDADICNGSLIDITELGIDIKRFIGKDKNDCHTFEGWKCFSNYDFTPRDSDFEKIILSQMRYYIHGVENNWPEIAKKKMAVADKKISIEKDFENENG